MNRKNSQEKSNTTTSILEKARACLGLYCPEWGSLLTGDEILLKTCINDLVTVMNGPLSPGYADSLNAVIYRYTSPVSTACILALHEHASDRQLFNLLDATIDYDLCSKPEIFKRYMWSDKFDYILDLGKKNKKRRLWLFHCICEWQFYEVSYGFNSRLLTTDTAVKLAQLLYPLVDADSTRQLSMLSACKFEGSRLEWVGLRYTIHIQSVQKRLLSRNLETNSLGTLTKALCKVLRILKSLDSSDSRRLYHDLLSYTAPKSVDGIITNSCNWFNYLNSVGNDLVSTSVLTSSVLLRWLIIRLRGTRPITCGLCKAYVGYYMLLYMDGHTFRKYAQLPPCDRDSSSVRFVHIMHQAVQWFLCRPGAVPMDLSTLSQHLLEVRDTFTDAEMAILDPVYIELDDTSTLYEFQM